MKITYSTITDINLRDNQEDYFKVEEIDLNIFIAIIGDGIGGHPAGEIASCLTMETFVESFKREFDGFHIIKMLKEFEDVIGSQLRIKINKCIQDCKDKILEHEQKNPDDVSMGCTFTGVIIIENFAIIVHIGDSYLKLIREVEGKKEIISLTRYHTGWYGGLTNYVGSSKYSQDPDIGLYQLKANDRLILATDGLKEKTLERLVENGIKYDAKILAEETKKDNSTDNITIIDILIE